MLRTYNVIHFLRQPRFARLGVNLKLYSCEFVIHEEKIQYVLMSRFYFIVCDGNIVLFFFICTTRVRILSRLVRMYLLHGGIELRAVI